ncbi:MAG TPA: response regulator transcription factor [Bacteroidales bacterium]|nr:response regulator transcription factor [Bacteroidales bacterium]
MKILIADDHSIVREGLKQYVKTLDEVELIDEAVNGNEAWARIKDGSYDLVILDVSMPGMSGLDVLRNIKERNLQTRVLMLSVHPQEQYAVHTFKLGASGYISKDNAFEELTLAIRKIASGGRYIGNAFAEKLAFNGFDPGDGLPHEKLSEREFQVMVMLAKGKSVMEISKEIFISDKTVSTYRARILEKMGMKKNAELTMYAIKNNLIE